MTYTEKLSTLPKDNETINTLAGAISEVGSGGGSAPDLSGYAEKSGLYKDATTPVDLEATCQSFETRISSAVTNTQLTTALDTSTAFMALDPTTSTSVPLDTALANINTPATRMSEQQIDVIAKKIAKEIVENPDYLRMIVKGVTDVITI